MLDANYVKVFKILGKLCYAYDLCAAEETNLDAIVATIQDQAATGDPAENPVLDTLRQRIIQLENARDTSGASVCQAAASDFFTSPYFTSKLVHNTPAGNSVADVLAAFQLEMSAAGGDDDKTLTTKHSSGLINFFDSLLAAPGTWNNEADATADYKDTVYVVLAVI